MLSKCRGPVKKRWRTSSDCEAQGLILSQVSGQVGVVELVDTRDLKTDPDENASD